MVAKKTNTKKTASKAKKVTKPVVKAEMTNSQTCSCGPTCSCGSDCKCHCHCCNKAKALIVLLLVVIATVIVTLVVTKSPCGRRRAPMGPCPYERKAEMGPNRRMRNRMPPAPKEAPAPAPVAAKD